jgi:hypothetical protein
VSHFATAEFESDLHLHVLAEKLHGMADLDPEVMRINLRTKLDFLDLGGVLVLLGFLVALGLFVAVFAEIDHPANRRNGCGSDLDQVNAVAAGQVQRFTQTHDAELLAVETDYPDFAGTDFPINPDERTGRR